MSDLISNIILIVVSSIVWLILLICIIYVEIKIKIHSSYHKGYSEGKTDEIFYYATIKSLKESFEQIYSNLLNKDISLDIELAELLIDYRKSLKSFQKKY